MAARVSINQAGACQEHEELLSYLDHIGKQNRITKRVSSFSAEIIGNRDRNELTKDLFEEVQLFEKGAPSVKKEGQKVNWLLFGALLVFGIVPSLIYIGVLNSFTSAEQLEDLIQSLNNLFNL